MPEVSGRRPPGGGGPQARAPATPAVPLAAGRGVGSRRAGTSRLLLLALLSTPPGLTAAIAPDDIALAWAEQREAIAGGRLDPAAARALPASAITAIGVLLQPGYSLDPGQAVVLDAADGRRRIWRRSVHEQAWTPTGAWDLSAEDLARAAVALVEAGACAGSGTYEGGPTDQQTRILLLVAGERRWTVLVYGSNGPAPLRRAIDRLLAQAP